MWLYGGWVRLELIFLSFSLDLEPLTPFVCNVQRAHTFGKGSHSAADHKR